MTRLCAVTDIGDNSSEEFDIELGGVRRYLIAVRQGEQVFVYLDFCPHLGYPENFVGTRFLMTRAKKIYCCVHGAWFRPEDGCCTDGPPEGDYLGRFETKVVDGEVFVGSQLIWPGRDATLRGLMHT